MQTPNSKNAQLAFEVLVQNLQDDPDYAMQWLHAVAKPFIAAGMPEPRAYNAAGQFMHESLRTFLFMHKDMPLCQDAVNKAASTLKALGWEYRNEAWRAPPAPEVIGFDLASGHDHTSAVIGRIDGSGDLIIDEIVTFDEKRADIIGQNGNDGEHYDAIEKKEDAVTFKALADKVDPPAAGLRRSVPPKHKLEVDLPDTTSMVDPTGRPSWANLAPWVSWIGQDRKGVWTGFAAKPEPRAGRWFSTKRYVELNSGEPAFAQDYTETLEPRP